MACASTGRNARYCSLGAKLPSQPLTEVTLHANHPPHIWEVIWMPLALVAPKSAGDWVKPKVNSTNWRESGSILPCTPKKRSVSSKLLSCQSCCIACTQCGWIRRNYGKLMGFKQSASVLFFFPSYPTSVHQSCFKRNGVAEKPLQTLVRQLEIETTMFISIHCSATWWWCSPTMHFPT